MKTTVSEKGQITVPKRVREQLALGPGTELEVELVSGGFVARKRMRQSPWKNVVGILRRRTSTDQLVDKMRGAADAVD
jgi:AbrB family looped-hinge helix DNA binding protein